MTFGLPLPRLWAKQRWKVKIWPDERTEPPHVTIVRKRVTWRLSLRDGAFLDSDPDPRDVPAELIAEIWRHRERLIEVWDAMYPENPVFSKGGGK